MGERGMGKVPGEIVGSLISHIEGVYGSQWGPNKITKIVAFIGLEAYKSNNRCCKYLNAEIYKMEILNP